jgi:SAM-dependent methyltransferase
MADSEQFNADQLAFWNGPGGDVWVARQQHTDVTLAPAMDAVLGLAQPRTGERVLDVGCGCGTATLDIARAVGPGGQVTALDISGPMLAEGRRRAAAAGIANVIWREADAATAPLEGFDLLASAFGVMFFGDPVAAFAHMRRAANPGARMAFVCWRRLAENPWIGTPMGAVLPHIPPRPPGNPQAPGMFAFADPQRVAEVLTEAGWARPAIEPFDFDLDIAAGRGLDAAVAQSTQIGAVNSWLRPQPPQVVASATASIREALAAHLDGASVRLPAGMWLVSSTAE